MTFRTSSLRFFSTRPGASSAKSDVFDLSRDGAPGDVRRGGLIPLPELNVDKNLMRFFCGFGPEKNRSTTITLIASYFDIPK